MFLPTTVSIGKKRVLHRKPYDVFVSFFWGESNFSFTLSLAQKITTGKNLISTCNQYVLDKAVSNEALCKELNVRTLVNIDSLRVACLQVNNTYYIILFNFCEKKKNRVLGQTKIFLWYNRFLLYFPAQVIPGLTGRVISPPPQRKRAFFFWGGYVFFWAKVLNFLELGDIKNFGETRVLNGPDRPYFRLIIDRYWPKTHIWNFRNMAFLITRSHGLQFAR